MIEDKKLISNIHAVQQFQNIFRVYIKILIPILFVTLILGYISIRTAIRGSRILEPYPSFLLIVITTSAIIFVPYFLYILFIEKKQKWIISFFIFVVIPFILAYMIFQQFFFYKMGAFPPVLCYSIYCYLLKSEVQKWLDQYYRDQRMAEAKKEKEDIYKTGIF